VSEAEVETLLTVDHQADPYALLKEEFASQQCKVNVPSLPLALRL